MEPFDLFVPVVQISHRILLIGARYNGGVYKRRTLILKCITKGGDVSSTLIICWFSVSNDDNKKFLLTQRLVIFKNVIESSD